jgi:ATP-binding cassette, subfamily B, bacterial MsbA
LSTEPDAADARAPTTTPRSALWRLFGYARPYVWPIALAVALASATSVGQIGLAYLMKPIMDDVVAPAQALREAGKEALPFDLGKVVPGASSEAVPPAAEPVDQAATHARLEQVSERLNQILWIVITIVLGTALIEFARDYLVAWVLGRIDLDMKVEVCGKLLALPLRFHRESARGDLLARLMGDVGTAQGALALVFDDFAQAAVMLPVGAVSLLFVSWQLSMVMLVLGPTIFLTISLFGRRIRRSARRRQRQFADVTGRLIEILEGIKVIKAFRAEGYEQEGFARSSRRLFRRGMRVAVNRNLARSLVDVLNKVAAGSVLVFGLFLVLRGHWGLTFGGLAAFAAIMITLYTPVRVLARGWVRVMDAEPSAERYFEVIDSPIEIHDAADAVTVPRIRDAVRFEAVSFTYGREPVLHQVSFEARAGEVLAIVGRTGAGKTTLVDLLMRFYDPTRGRITFDGVDLRQARRDSLLDQMAVVSQEPFLFDGTIRENIRYGRLDATEEEILAAARAAHVDEFADGLPDGYDTEVGAGGTRLSGGQRQRVTIARAILRDPAILVLDEATSSLDSKSERLVQDAIEKLLPGRTVFVIAHRLSTVRAAHKIVVLEHGNVSQIGNHEELFAQAGLYRELVELQSGVVVADTESLS